MWYGIKCLTKIHHYHTNMLFQVRPAQTTLPFEFPPPLREHYIPAANIDEHKIINHYVIILGHVSGTHFTTGWMGILYDARGGATTDNP